jgi:two-component system chemotaxis response regulator CheY
MGERKTVLVVEDDPEQRAVIRGVLEAMGLFAVEATDGSAAVAALAGIRPDLICLELLLPESSGYELCEMIRRSPVHRDTPVLVMSDRAYPEDRAHALEAGADAFIVRPFDEEDLRRRIEALLEPDREVALAS